jgi:hypothetical protein
MTIDLIVLIAWTAIIGGTCIIQLSQEASWTS